MRWGHRVLKGSCPREGSGVQLRWTAILELEFAIDLMGGAFIAHAQRHRPTGCMGLRLGAMSRTMSRLGEAGCAAFVMGCQMRGGTHAYRSIIVIVGRNLFG